MAGLLIVNSFAVSSKKCSEIGKKKKPVALDQRKSSNVVVIVCSILGGLLVVGVLALILMKLKKKKNPRMEKLSTRNDAKTFVNASFET